MRRAFPGLVLSVALLLGGAAFASPLRHPPGAHVARPSEALVSPYRPLNVLAVDLDADGRREEAVLFGHSPEGGVARVDGLLLLTRERRGLRVVGAVRFDGHPAERYTLVDDSALDLDRDGALELVVAAELMEAGVERTVRTWWSWRRDGEGAPLLALHRSEVRYRDAGVPGTREAVEVTREVTPVDVAASAAPALVERVTERRGPKKAPIVHAITYRLDAARARFTPTGIFRGTAAPAP